LAHFLLISLDKPMQYEIFPMSETKFYYTVVNAQIEFMADENGEVTKLILYQDGKEMTGKKVK
jgi:hypothetical protein